MARFLLLVVLAALTLANANVGPHGSASIVTTRTNKLQKADIVAAVNKGKAAVVAPVGLLSKAAADKLQLVGLFAVWYAFNAGCEFFGDPRRTARTA